MNGYKIEGKKVQIQLGAASLPEGFIQFEPTLVGQFAVEVEPGRLPFNTEQPIDHRELLKKYLRYVKDYEGSDFVHAIGYAREGNAFTAEERAELEQISEEAAD